MQDMYAIYYHKCTDEQREQVRRALDEPDDAEHVICQWCKDAIREGIYCERCWKIIMTKKEQAQ